ncbi:MAG TPA: hypothetical protein VIP57_07315 [Candidatus Dormibacteraeota bacterium]
MSGHLATERDLIPFKEAWQLCQTREGNQRAPSRMHFQAESS